MKYEVRDERIKRSNESIGVQDQNVENYIKNNKSRDLVG